MSKVNLKGQKAKAWTPGLQAELEAFVQQSLKRSGVPGVSVSVVQNGKVVYAKGFGVREAGKNDPVTPETLMMIGSTGKTMTTLLMAQLVDEGRLTWDTPVVKLMPQFRVADPALTNTLTVQNLVCACTGAPRRDLELLFKASKWTAERTIESLKDIRFYTKVGEAFHYSNQMVATGGYVAAMADGAKYGNLLEGYIQSVDRRIFKPLGMTSTTLRMNQALSRPNRAVPHGLFLDASYRPISTEAERFVMPVAPAGAPWSNAVDMGRYLIAELSVGVGSDGKRIVSEKNLRQTWTPQVPMSAETSYGLGWFVSNYKGLPLLSHGGNTMGFTSDLAFLPGEGVGISVLSNGRGTNALNQAIRTRLFELLYGVAAEAQTELEHSLETVKGSFEALGKQIKTVDAAALRAYLGAYNSSSLGSAVLSVNDGKLVLDAGEVVLELGSIGDGRFVVTNPPLLGQGVTLEQRDGRFNIVIGEGRDAYTFTKR